MMLALFLLAASVAIGGVLAISLAIVRWGRDGGVPQERPVWLGPDPVAIEAAVRAELARRREGAGGGPLEQHPATSELARHHAHDMAVRRFQGSVDPEGVDLAERRRRLHPTFVGAMLHGETSVPADAASSAAGIARSLLDSEPALEAMTIEPRWSLLGVGVAVEGGRCACCVVVAHWWGTLDHKVKGDLHPSGLILEGVVQPGTSVDQLGFGPRDGGQTRPAAAVPGRQEGRFQVHAEVEPGSGVEVQIVRDGVPGLVRKA